MIIRWPTILVNFEGSLVWDMPVHPFEGTLYLIPPNIEKEAQLSVNLLRFIQFSPWQSMLGSSYYLARKGRPSLPFDPSYYSNLCHVPWFQ